MTPNATLNEEYANYLDYLYDMAGVKYSDCPDIDNLVQETMLSYIIKIKHGEAVEYPKGFLSAVMKRKYNDILREKYRNRIVTYEIPTDIEDEVETTDSFDEEYEIVRREIGRLVKIYREVVIRHYINGESVEVISSALGIPEGTVKHRLHAARGQIKEGIFEMEKYSRESYAPKSLTLGIWGGTGLSGEPFSLVKGTIEQNIIILAYKRPISIRDLADMIGMPAAYIEPSVEQLINGELMGKTSGGLVYTRCFLQKYSESFGEIPKQEALADKNAETVWNISWRHIEGLIHRPEFEAMTEKQKATLILHIINDSLSNVCIRCKPQGENEPKRPPERANGASWLASGTIFENGEKSNNKYSRSGPVTVGYSAEGNGNYSCIMHDTQCLFGDAHWAYNDFDYKFGLGAVLRFYSSFLPCGITPENDLIYELIPEFERLHILRRDETGRTVLDIPVLTFEDGALWNDAAKKIIGELVDVIGEDIRSMWLAHQNRVPGHIDCPEYYRNFGALGAYPMAQLVSIVEGGHMPYRVEIGKTPIIVISYRKTN